MIFLLPAATAEEVEARVVRLRAEVLGEYDVLKRAELQRELRDFEDILRLHRQALKAQAARGQDAADRGTP